MKYLMKLTPLEPYSFGTEEGYKFKEVESSTGKSTYFVKSQKLVEQTAILGTLRYLLLMHNGKLKKDFSYTDEERNEMAKLIGAESFSFSADKIQNFGKIKTISPVFLVDEKNQKYIRAPFHIKKKDKSFIEMMDEEFDTSFGKIHLPKIGEYNAKDGHIKAFYCLENKEMIMDDDLFESIVMTGNRKFANDQDGFFKRETIRLKEGFSFAVYIDLEEIVSIPQQEICYMGQKKSAFEMEFIPCETDTEDLIDEVKKTFSSEKGRWYYALSNILVNENYKIKDFSIVEKKLVRNLQTVYGKKRYVDHIQRNDKQLSLIESGSVFMADEDFTKNFNNENCKKIGYNYLVEIGGNN